MDKSRTRRLIRITVLALLMGAVCVLPVLRASAVVKTWTGNLSGYWSNTNNWSPMGAPANGDSLVFPTLAAGKYRSMINNLAGRTFASMTFQASGYTLRSNAVTLTSGISCLQTSGTNTITIGIILNGNQSIEVQNAAAVLVAATNINLNGFDLVVTGAGSNNFSGVISGTGSLIKRDPGTLTLSGTAANTFSGTTRVEGGTLLLGKISGSTTRIAVPGPLIIADGAPRTNVVQLVQNSQIATNVEVRLEGAASLKLNGRTNLIGELTLVGGGEVDAGTGRLDLVGNVRVTGMGSPATIKGNFYLGTEQRTFVVDDITAGADLVCWATISGGKGGAPAFTPAGITKQGAGELRLAAANTFGGQTLVNEGILTIANSLGLGAATNVFGSSGTLVNGAGVVQLDNLSVTNESLVLNSLSAGGALRAVGISRWKGSLRLDAEASVASASALFLEGAISGTGGFNKVGSGDCTLAGTEANSYSGTTTIKEGVLLLNKSPNLNAVPAGLVVGDGVGGHGADVVRLVASYQIPSAAVITINDSGLLDLNGQTDDLGPVVLNGGDIATGLGTVRLVGDVTVQANAVSSSIISGNLELASTRTFTTLGHFFSPDLTVSAAISGNGGLIKAGEGEMSLSGASSFGGLVTVNGGTLQAGQATALGSTASGTVVNAGASLVVWFDTQVGNEPLTLNGNGHASAGALVGLWGSNSWSGPITLGGATRISVGRTNDVLNLVGPVSGAADLTKVGPGALLFSGGSANAISGTTTVAEGLLELRKSAAGAAIAGPLVIGDGFGGANADIVQIPAGRPAQFGSAVSVNLGSSGILKLSHAAEQVAALSGSGNVSLTGTALTVAPSGATSIMTGIISGSGSLVKQGTGLLRLAGNNTYTGMTTVSNGMLVVNGTQPQTDVNVLAGGMLGGSGTLRNITLQGGTLSPGDAVGALTCSNLTLNASSTYRADLRGSKAGVGYDQLKVRGTAKLANATLNAVAGAGSPVEGVPLTLLANEGNASLEGIFAGLPEGAVLKDKQVAYVVSYQAGAGRDISLTLTNAPLKPVSAIVTGGNGNLNTIDPNECLNFSLVVSNSLGVPLTGISTRLTTTSPYAMITQPYSGYPNIAPAGTATNVTAFQLSTLPDLPCGTLIELLLMVDSAEGAFTFRFQVQSGSAGVPIRLDNNVSLPLGDLATTESTILVSNYTNLVVDVAVSLHITHNNAADLAVYLIGPDGTTAELSSGGGVGGANYGAGCADNQRTTLEDASPVSIDSAAPPYVGSYRPETPLVVFRGKSRMQVNGLWRLRVVDQQAGNAGQLQCWSLFLTPATCAPDGGPCVSCPGVMAGSITTNDLVQLGRMPRLLDPISSCDFPKACPGVLDSDPRHCDVYAFTNTAHHDLCVYASVETACSGDLFAAAYLNRFNPASICENYLADIGGSPAGESMASKAFSFSVPAGAVFLVVVSEVTPGAGCASYTLSVAGFECGPRLHIASTPDPNLVRLFWTTDSSGYQLESRANVNSSSFQPVLTPPVAFGGYYNVTNHTGGTNCFYRLRKP